MPNFREEMINMVTKQRHPIVQHHHISSSLLQRRVHPETAHCQTADLHRVVGEVFVSDHPSGMHRHSSSLSVHSQNAPRHNGVVRCISPMRPHHTLLIALLIMVVLSAVPSFFK